MAFVLIEVDQKPMRVKGVAMLPGIAVTDDMNSIRKGSYRGLQTSQCISVLNSGGTAFPDASSRAGFAASHPVPISLAAENIQRLTLLNDVFVDVTEEGTQRVSDISAAVSALAKELENFWVPARFTIEGGMLGTGWVRQDQEGVLLRVVHAFGAEPIGTIEVALLHLPEIGFKVDL